MRHHAALALAAAGALIATPSLAHGHRPHMLPHWGGPFGAWYGGWQTPTVIEIASETAPAETVPAPRDRDEWLRECRHRLGANGVTGAVIGGAVGAVAGNAVAGRGDKVAGTVAGAAVGAIAGAAIDRATNPSRMRDRCETMLESWGQGPTAYSYGYGVPVMMVPVTMMPAAAPPRGPCKETVVTEEIETSVPRRSRLIPPRAKPVPDKRVRLVPDKRVAQ